MPLSTFEVMWNEKDMGVVENEKCESSPRSTTSYKLPELNWRPSLYNFPRSSRFADGERQPLLPRHTRIDSERQQLSSPDEHPEAARLDVLYNIFFISVVSLYTFVNGVDDCKAAKSFTAFFALLWTTWYQVTLHRSTFSVNDIFATLLQICQLGVLCLFATYGLYFRHGLGFALALSRVVLLVQYSQSWLFVQNTRQRERRLGLVVAIKAVGLLALVLADMHGLQSLWYWIVAVETVVDTVAFAQSNNNEQSSSKALFLRLNNLTVVTLASGILALARTYFELGAKGLLKLDIWVVANVLCFFLTIYVVYALQSSSSRYSATREKRGALWSLLNFPLHLALFLSMAYLAPAVLRVGGSSKQSAMAVFSLGAVTVLVGLLRLSSKQLRQINSREVACVVLSVVVGVAIMHSTNAMNVSERGEELLAAWALPVVVLKLAFVLIVDKVWARANSRMAEEGRECVSPSLAWWTQTSFMGSW